MKSKSLNRFKIWLILKKVDWLVFRERIKCGYRWFKYELPRKVWAWKLRRMRKKEEVR